MKSTVNRLFVTGFAVCGLGLTLGIISCQSRSPDATAPRAIASLPAKDAPRSVVESPTVSRKESPGKAPYHRFDQIGWAHRREIEALIREGARRPAKRPLTQAAACDAAARRVRSRLPSAAASAGLRADPVAWLVIAPLAVRDLKCAAATVAAPMSLVGFLATRANAMQEETLSAAAQQIVDNAWAEVNAVDDLGSTLSILANASALTAVLSPGEAEVVNMSFAVAAASADQYYGLVASGYVNSPPDLPEPMSMVPMRRFPGWAKRGLIMDGAGCLSGAWAAKISGHPGIIGSACLGLALIASTAQLWVELA